MGQTRGNQDVGGKYIVLLTLVSFVAVLMVIVLAHEIGHFVTARAFKVKVEEFGLGFPPRLFSITRGGTRYSINATPLGGFVKMAGEVDPGVEGSLASKGAGVRILVLAAGSLMNFLLPVLLFTIAFMVPHNVSSGEVLVDQVYPESPAALAGIEEGDSILVFNGTEVGTNQDVQRQVLLNLGNKIDIMIEKPDGSRETVSLTPRWRPPGEQGATGIAVSTQAVETVRRSLPFWEAIPRAVAECVETFVLFKNVIIGMVIGTVPFIVTGPVGIAQISGEAARAGLGPLLEFAAFFSVNLAIINIFPLPALDGGRIAFVLLEWLRRGRRVSVRTEGLVHFIGFALLMAAAVLITYQDILRIISGESLIP